jgi:uncharacterized protein (TIGR00725 family)
MLSIALFGSSLPREGQPAYEEARAVGRALARRGARIVCGGYGGVMEAACRGASEEGGQSLGVTLAGRGKPNSWVTSNVEAPNLAERLTRLRDLSDGWIFLPHGLGTMLELVWLAESVVKRDVVARPLVLLGVFWKSTLETALREATGSGAEALAAWVRWANSPEEAAGFACGEAGVISSQ